MLNPLKYIIVMLVIAMFSISPQVAWTKGGGGGGGGGGHGGGHGGGSGQVKQRGAHIKQNANSSGKGGYGQSKQNVKASGKGGYGQSKQKASGKGGYGQAKQNVKAKGKGGYGQAKQNVKASGKGGYGYGKQGMPNVKSGPGHIKPWGKYGYGQMFHGGWYKPYGFYNFDNYRVYPGLALFSGLALSYSYFNDDYDFDDFLPNFFSIFANFLYYPFYSYGGYGYRYGDYNYLNSGYYFNEPRYYSANTYFYRPNYYPNYDLQSVRYDTYYYWIKAREGEVPANAVVYTTYQGSPVFYCRKNYNNHLEYGWMIPEDGCYISLDGDSTIRFTHYEVLVRNNF